MLKEYLMRPFRGRFFRLHGIAEEGRISGVWGDLAGFAASSDLMSAFARRAKQGRLSRFRYFGREELDFCLVKMYLTSSLMEILPVHGASNP